MVDEAEAESDGQAVARLRATAHPVRLRIMSLLTAQAMSAAEVARELELTHANASYHLRLLHDIGELVVESEEKIRGGTAKRYRYDASRELADRTSGVDDRIAYARANAVEVERRLLDAAKGAGLLQRPGGLGPRGGVAPGPRPAPRGRRTCCTPRRDRQARRTPSTSAPPLTAFTMTGGLDGEAVRWIPAREQR